MDSQSQPIHFGPFTKDTFDQQEWNQYVPTLIPTRGRSNSWQGANYDLLLQFLRQINNSPDYNDYFGDPSIKEYFFEQLFPSGVSKLLNQVPPRESEARDTIGKCLEEFMILWCKAYNEGSPGLMKILTCLLEPNTGFYATYHFTNFFGRGTGLQTNFEEERRYTKTRPANTSVSTFYYDLLNKFGESGGFDLILRRLCDENESLPAEFVTEVCSIIAKAKYYLNEQFLKEYLPKFHEGVFEHVLMNKFETSQSDYATKIQSVLGTLNLLIRIPWSPEISEAYLDFELKMLSRCLNSSSLSGKICTLFMLENCILTANRSGEALKNLKRFLVDKNVFYTLYSENISPELFKTSRRYFAYMFKQNLLTPQDIELVLDIYTRRGDGKIRQELSEILDGAVNTQYADCILTKVLETPLDEIKETELNLIKALYPSVSSTQIGKKIWEIYCKLTTPTQNPQAPRALTLVTALNKLHFHCLEINPHYKDAIIDTLGDEVAKIGGDLPTLKVFQQIYGLLNQFPKNLTSPSMLSRGKCVTRLCLDKNLLGIIFEELKSFKNQLQQKGNISSSTLTPGGQPLVPQEYTNRLEFIIMLLSSGGEAILTYKVLNEMWNIVVVDALNPSARKLGLDFFKGIAGIEDENIAEKVGLMRFFREKLTYERLQTYADSVKEVFKFFKNFFVMVNRSMGKLLRLKPSANKAQDEFSYTLKAPPEEVEGLDTIWRFLIEVKHNNTVDVTEAADMLIKLYVYTDEEVRGKTVSVFERNCAMLFESILQKPDDVLFKDRCLVYFSLIKMSIEATEKEGFGHLKSHLESSKGEDLTICISDPPSFSLPSQFNNSGSQNMNQPQTEQFKFSIDSASTVLDLRIKVAENTGLSWNEFELSFPKDKRKIDHNDNHKTLQSLNLSDNQIIYFARKQKPYVEQIDLMRDGALIPKMQEIVISWFDEYSDNGKMSPDLFYNFLLSDLHRSYHRIYQVSNINRRVSKAFALANKNKDGFLSLEDFIKYHILTLEEAPQEVRASLSEKRYREDLKQINNLGQIYVDITLLPRYLVSANNQHFQLLFSVLDSVPEVAAQAWELISVLPTNPQVFADIVSLRGIQGFIGDSDAKWKHLLSSDSDYKFLYSLYIINGLLQPNQDNDPKKRRQESFLEKFLWSENSQLTDKKQSWKANFLAYGGLKHLVQIFIRNSEIKSHNIGSSTVQRHVNILILRIMAHYGPNKLSLVDEGKFKSLYAGTLKKTFMSLTSLARDFLDGKKVALSNEEGSDQIMEKLGVLNKEDLIADLSQILSSVDLKSLVGATLEQASSVRLDADDFMTEEIMIMKSSVCILAAVLSYQESY